MQIEVLADPDAVAARAPALIAEEARRPVAYPCSLVILFAKARAGASPAARPFSARRWRRPVPPTRSAAAARQATAVPGRDVTGTSGSR